MKISLVLTVCVFCLALGLMSAENRDNMLVEIDGPVKWIVVSDRDYEDGATWKVFIIERSKAVKAKKRLPRTPEYNDPSLSGSGSSRVEAPYVYRGALLLQDFFKKITGAELAIISEKEWIRKGSPEAVLVGQTQMAKKVFGENISREYLDDTASVLKTGRKHFFITGNGSQAIFYGCSRLLQDYCEVDWFWPTELGEEYAEKSELDLNDIDVIVKPAFEFSWSGLRKDARPWAMKLGMRWPPRMVCGHALGKIFYPDFYESNPEWFPLIDGKRLKPKVWYAGWQPCMGNPSSIQRATKKGLEFFSENPDAVMFDMGLNDSVWQPCECQFCAKLDGRPDSAFDTTPMHYSGIRSTRYFNFLSQVASRLAKQYPDKFVGGYSYAGTDVPPANVKPNKNVMITMCGTKLAWVNPELRKWEELRLRKWSKLVGAISIYDYMYQTWLTPRYIPHLRADIIKLLYECKTRVYYAETYPTIARSGPKYWIIAKLLNNPDENVDTLIDHFMNGFFKEAAKPMKKFYATIEQAWYDYPYHNRYVKGWSSYCYRDSTVSGVLTPAVLEKLGKLLNQAAAMAKDEKVKKRLSMIQKTFPMTREASLSFYRNQYYVLPLAPDEKMFLNDLKAHSQSKPVFDFYKYYEKNCKNNVLTDIGKDMKYHPRFLFDSPSKRLGRIIDGIILKALGNQIIAGGVNKALATKKITAEINRISKKNNIPKAMKQEIRQLASKVVYAAEIEKKPELNGSVDDSCWKLVPTYTPFSFVKKAGGKLLVAANKTEFKVCYDRDYLYFAVTCYQKPDSITAKAAENNQASIAKDDYIEITLDVAHTFRKAFKVMVNPKGYFSDSLAGYGSKYWNSAVRTGAKITKTGYQLEIAIPYSAFLFSPGSENMVSFNIARKVRKNGEELSFWYPLNVKMDWWDARGMTFLVFNTRDNRKQMWKRFSGKIMKNLNTGKEMIPLIEGKWEFWEILPPVKVGFDRVEGKHVIKVNGTKAILVSKQYLDIHSGYPHEIVVEYNGDGVCQPYFRWYEGEDRQFNDILPTAKEKRKNESQQKRSTTKNSAGITVTKATLVAPNAARYGKISLICEGEVNIVNVYVQPILPLDVTIDISCRKMSPGQVFELVATVENNSKREVNSLELKMGWPFGVDIMKQGVMPAKTLSPGEKTQSIWYLTPIYTETACPFTITVVADGIAPFVVKSFGPVVNSGQSGN